MALAIGVDIGGTKVAGGLVDEDGTRRRAGVRRDTPSLDPVATESTLGRGDPRAGRAGRTRSSRWASARPGSSTRTAPASGSRPTWPGARSRCAQRVEERTGFAGRRRERRQRRRAGPRSGSAPPAASATSSWSASAPGSAGGLVLGGQLYRGRSGMAGEFGHVRLVPDGPAVRVRPARLLGAVRQRQRAGPRGPGAGPRCRRQPRGCSRTGTGRRRVSPADDHRGRPRGRPLASPASRRSDAGWAGGSPSW